MERVDAPAWQAGTTIALIAFTFLLMAVELAPPDMLMLATLLAFILTGIISTTEATSGFSQTGLLTVMVLFAVTTGLERTGAFEPVRKLIIPKRGARTTSLPELIARYALPVSVISAFLNNTPVVSLMIATVSDMAAQAGLPPSKLLIPLSACTGVRRPPFAMRSRVSCAHRGICTHAHAPPPPSPGEEGKIA
jgi:Na+/H+ antiporter NhaD/arsenite permease-like protein